MIQQYRIYIIIVGVILLIGSVYAYGVHNANKNCELKRLEEEQQRQEQQNEFQSKLQAKSEIIESLNTQLRQKTANIQKRLNDDIKIDDSYKPTLPVNGMQLRAEAIANIYSR